MSSGKIIPTVLFIIFMAACAGDDTVTEEQKPISIEFPDVDSTIHIQEDFYHFVNNKWLQTTAVPSGSHKWDHIDMLKSSSRRAVRQLLDFSAGNNPYQERSDMWKAVRFYTLGMDSLKAERDGLLPVGDFLNKIERMENERQMAVFFAEYQQKVSGLFFEVGLKPGDKNHHQDAINIYAGKTGIPRPEYYLEKGDEYDRIRMAYIEYITELLGHLSLDEEVAREQALTILNIETKLVSPASKWKNVPSQDTSYHSMRVADLKKLAENIEWVQYFNEMDIDSGEYIILKDPSYIRVVNDVMAIYSLDQIKSYLRWRVLNDAAPYLHHVVANRYFTFYEKFLNGVKKIPPRWNRVLTVTDEVIGDAPGKLYAKNALTTETRQKAGELGHYMKRALAGRIKALDWMSDTTKIIALNKLKNVELKVGYPESWKSYKEMDLEAETYYENIMQARLFVFENKIANWKQGKNQSFWPVTPQTVRVVYDKGNNELIIPAAVIQSPLFDVHADDALNFGALGVMVARELLRGFNEEGSQVDEKGNLYTWWKAEEYEKFNDMTARVKEPLNNYFLKDSLLMTENHNFVQYTNEMGAINVAFDGLTLCLRETERTDLIEGLSQEQRFFISLGRLYAVKHAEEVPDNFMLSEGIDAGATVVNGVLTQVNAFRKVFSIISADSAIVNGGSNVEIW